jgi:anti-sigma factor RsiW
MTGADRMTALEANALADGELSGDAAAEARLAVASHEDLRTAAAWRDTLSAQLHAAYDGELERPLPARTRKLLAAKPGWALPSGARRLAAAAAIAIAAGGLGFGLGSLSLVKDDNIDRVVRMALGAHQVYAGEIRHPVEVPGSDSSHLAKWLGARIGVPFSAPDITDTGFALVGGRLLAEGQRPAALLMYEDAVGRRVTLYMEKWPNSDETELQHLASGGLNTFYWTDKNFACAVSGNLDPAKLKVVSEQLYAALERG